MTISRIKLFFPKVKKKTKMCTDNELSLVYLVFSALLDNI